LKIKDPYITFISFVGLSLVRQWLKLELVKFFGIRTLPLISYFEIVWPYSKKSFDMRFLLCQSTISFV